jgi:hypothetical protein
MLEHWPIAMPTNARTGVVAKHQGLNELLSTQAGKSGRSIT